MITIMDDSLNNSQDQNNLAKQSQGRSDQAPASHTTKAMTETAHGGQTPKCSPGDQTLVSGTSADEKSASVSSDTYDEDAAMEEFVKAIDDHKNIFNDELIRWIEGIRYRPPQRRRGRKRY